MLSASLLIAQQDQKSFLCLVLPQEAPAKDQSQDASRKTNNILPNQMQPCHTQKTSTRRRRRQQPLRRTPGKIHLPHNKERQQGEDKQSLDIPGSSGSWSERDFKQGKMRWGQRTVVDRQLPSINISRPELTMGFIRR